MVKIIVNCKVLWQQNPNITNVPRGPVNAEYYKETAVAQKIHTCMHAHTYTHVQIHLLLSGCCFLFYFSHPSR